MPDPNKEAKKKEAEFIREKIVKRPETLRKRLGRFLVLLLCAILFGAVASLTFVYTRPYFDEMINGAETAPTQEITIPKDDEPTQEPETTLPAVETESESESVTESETPTETAETIELPSEPESAPAPEYGITDYKLLSKTIAGLLSETKRGMVTVTGVTTDVDWFNNELEKKGLFSGIIAEITETEVLILTSYDVTEYPGALKVTFVDGTTRSAQIKASDRYVGIAVASVPVLSLQEQTRELVKKMVLGNSYGVQSGDTVIAIGRPYGMSGSVAMGHISYISADVQGVDAIYRVLYTDLNLPEKGAGFLMNLDGEIVGVLDRTLVDESMTCAIAISNLKPMLEVLYNGKSVPYLGINGMTVPDEVTEQTGMPSGVYVTEVIQDSPAYVSRIQNGDVITMIDDKEITTMKDLQSRLEAGEPDSTVTVTVQRSGKEEYREIVFEVKLTAR